MEREVMTVLTTVQRLRLYEALGNIAESLPSAHRKDFYRVCRWRAVNIRDDSEIRRRRALVRKHVVDLAMNDWRWVLAVLPDDRDPVTGEQGVTLRRWAKDAGHLPRTT